MSDESWPPYPHYVLALTEEGWQVCRFLGPDNPRATHLSFYGDHMERPKLAAAGPHKVAMIAYLRLIDARAVWDWSVPGVNWDSEPVPWQELRP